LFGAFNPSDGFLESAAFVPRDVQHMGFVGEAVDERACESRVFENLLPPVKCEVGKFETKI